MERVEALVKEMPPTPWWETAAFGAFAAFITAMLVLVIHWALEKRRKRTAYRATLLLLLTDILQRYVCVSQLYWAARKDKVVAPVAGVVLADAGLLTEVASLTRAQEVPSLMLNMHASLLLLEGVLSSSFQVPEGSPEHGARLDRYVSLYGGTHENMADMIGTLMALAEKEGLSKAGLAALRVAAENARRAYEEGKKLEDTA